MFKAAPKKKAAPKQRSSIHNKSNASKKIPVRRVTRRALSTQTQDAPPAAVSAPPTPQQPAPVKVPLCDSIKVSSDVPIKSKTILLPQEPNVTVLPNKIKVFSQASTTPLTHLQVTVRIGSKHESHIQATSGYTNFLGQLMTNVVSAPEWDFSEALANQGTTIHIQAHREFLTISASTAADYKPVLEAMADLVEGDAWRYLCDFPEEQATYLQTFPFRELDPGQRFQDDIHEGAFFGTGLGYPLHGTEGSIDGCTETGLVKWQKRFFTGNRILVGGLGVDDKEFPKLVQEMFGDIPTTEETFPEDFPEKEDYLLIHTHHKIDNFDDSQDLQHVSVAWHGPDIKSPFIVPMSVLSTILGEASEWSSGGPGKGMYSRMTTNVVRPHDYITQASTFFINHQYTSLFGVYGMVPAQDTGAFIDVIMNELTTLPQTITEVEVSRAKNQLKRKLLLHYQDNGSRLNELSVSIAHHDNWIGPQHLRMIDECTLDQVKQSAELLFDPNSVVVTTLGNPEYIPEQYQTKEILTDANAPSEQLKDDLPGSRGGVFDSIKSFFGGKK